MEKAEKVLNKLKDDVLSGNIFQCPEAQDYFKKNIGFVFALANHAINFRILSTEEIKSEDFRLMQTLDEFNRNNDCAN